MTITVFGSINLDLIGAVERLPGPGETVPGSSFATAPGDGGRQLPRYRCRRHHEPAGNGMCCAEAAIVIDPTELGCDEL